MSGPPQWLGRIFFGQDSSAFSPGEADGIHTFPLSGPIFGLTFLKDTINNLTSDRELLLIATVGDDLEIVNRFELSDDDREALFPLNLEIIADLIFLQHQYQNSQKNLAFAKGIFEYEATGPVNVTIEFTSESLEEPMSTGSFSLDFDSGKDDLPGIIGMLEKYKEISPSDLRAKERAESKASRSSGGALYRRSGGTGDGYVFFRKGNTGYFCGALESRDTAQFSLEGDTIRDLYNSSGGATVDGGMVKNNVTGKKVNFTDTHIYPSNNSSSSGYLIEGTVVRPATTGCVYENCEWILEEGFPKSAAAFILGGMIQSH